MHLKIFIGVLILGLAQASPKAAEKREAKPSHLFQDYPSVQPNYLNGYYAAQSYPGQHSSSLYNARYSPSIYGASYGNAFGQAYSQVPAFGYYQSSQQIPVPVTYSSGFSASDAQSANYFGAGRLWPKQFVSPTGSPSPAPVNSQFYYPSSTASPIAYQSTSNYGYSLLGNSHIPVSTPSPIHAHEIIPAPVAPVKIGLRSSFQPEVTNYNTVSQNIPVPVSTPASFLANYQQKSYTPFVKSYQQSSVPYSAFKQYGTSSPFAVQYQQPASSPYLVNYQQRSTPAPFKFSYQQQPSPAPYQVNYQLPSVSSRSSFPAYQQKPTISAYSAQYQQPALAHFRAHYQQPATSHFSSNYQRIPVAFPQNHYQIQPVKPTLTYPVSTSVPVQSVSIAEKAFVPIATTPTPIVTPTATIVKSEYNAGSVSPHYNHASLYSTPSPFSSVTNGYLPQSVSKSIYGHSYAPFQTYSTFSPVSHANYNALGHSYSY